MRNTRYTVVDQKTGEVKEVSRVPHQLEGKGYTMQSRGAEVPLYALGLTGSEWSVIDWLKEHGAASEAIGVEQAVIAEDIHATAPTVKAALGRLVKLGVAVRTKPRSSTYQLNPRRFWEGAGNTQLRRIQRAEPPRVRPDEKAKKTAKLAQEKKSRHGTGGSGNVRSIAKGRKAG